jgi:hypothetical protein
MRINDIQLEDLRLHRDGIQHVFQIQIIISRKKPDVKMRGLHIFTSHNQNVTTPGHVQYRKTLFLLFISKDFPTVAHGAKVGESSGTGNGDVIARRVNGSEL